MKIFWNIFCDGFTWHVQAVCDCKEGQIASTPSHKDGKKTTYPLKWIESQKPFHLKQIEDFIKEKEISCI